MCLVGNKSDRSDVQVSYDETITFAKQYNIPYSTFVSARTGEKIEELFTWIATNSYNKYKSNEEDNCVVEIKEDSKQQNKCC